MKYLILLQLLLATIILSLTEISCSTSLKSEGSIIPYPRTLSIIPLERGNWWIFNHTEYNDDKIVSQKKLHLKVGHSYGFKNDSLISLDNANPEIKYLEYIYEYEFENSKMGNLISYRDTFVDTTGIYIRGYYEAEKRILYDKPILWLKYPSVPGDTWTIIHKNNKDTTPVYMETIDTSTTLNIPSIEPSPSAVSAVNCYLYKETIGDIVNYYYYSKTYGLVAFLSYINGKLHRNFIIEDFYHM